MNSRPGRVFAGVLLLTLLSGALHADAGALTAGTPDGVVKLDSGLISGQLSAGIKDVRIFKGIPYAAPPVGQLRWKAPQPVKPWIGIRPCTEFGPAELQLNTLEVRYGDKIGRTSEDCLYLNVYAPAELSGKFPVMVWIHGGGYTAGEGATYDGENLARLGAVVVTINYRLGVFGFFAHPALSKESGHNSSGDYGLQDQIAALHWVKRNIAAFGGDPARVTIFGESAGGGCVIYLMSSPLANGLFQRAIVESGASIGDEQKLADVEKHGEHFASQLWSGAKPDAIAGLRALSGEYLFHKATDFEAASSDDAQSLPAVDGWVVPAEPVAVFQSGHGANVPLLIGCNSDEGSLFTGGANFKSVEDYEKNIRATYPNADAIISLYKVSNVSEAKAAIGRAFTDRLAAGSVLFARLNSKFGRDTFLYHFSKPSNDPRFAGFGAHHRAEIPYVFSGGTAMPHFDASDVELGRVMSRYWVQFATSGNPNSPGLPEWPKYESSSDRYIELGVSVKPGSGMVPKNVMDVFGTVPSETGTSK